jgi:serine/threonine protein kinase
VKIIAKSSIVSALSQTRLMREMAFLRRMDHPFIAKLFQITEDDDFHYIAMEYVDKGNLLEYVNENGRFNEKQARHYFCQLVWVLDYLHHDQKVAHRDLKCENILLDRNMNVRLIDFGLSGQFTEFNPQLNTLCGSPAYAPPEMVKGQPYTKVADIWSAGVVLFAIVAGYLPFDDDNLQRMLHKIVFTEVVYPPFMTSPLVDLLEKMICKSPELRIDVDRIKSHPWFSNTEYTSLVRMMVDETQWLPGDAMGTTTAVDPEIIARIAALDIDVRDLSSALLAREETDKTILYSVLLRDKLTDRIRDAMHEISHGPALMKPLAKPGLARTTIGAEKPVTILMGIGSNPQTPKQPVVQRRLSKPAQVAIPQPATPVKIACGRVLGSVAAPSGRRLSRPTVRKATEPSPLFGMNKE